MAFVIKYKEVQFLAEKSFVIQRWIACECSIKHFCLQTSTGDMVVYLCAVDMREKEKFYIRRKETLHTQYLSFFSWKKCAW